MTTEVAIRRLIEALAEANKSPDPDIGRSASPLLALAVGFRAGSDQVAEQEQPQTARIFAAMAALATAVDKDTRKVAQP